MTDAGIHSITRLWVRPAEGAPMEPRDALDLVAGEGVRGDHAFSRMRHVTIVFADDWNRAAAAIGREVDPVGRRANVLVTGGHGARFVGKTIRLGGATIEVKGITRPCPQMDKAAPGMMDALKPDGRSGVWGRVVSGAVVRIGDGLDLAPDASVSSSAS